MKVGKTLRAGAIITFGLAAGPVTAGTVVLELFTSQGCSNCPPADLLFADYANRPDVVALSLPVDIWNYLGWDDTLAHHDHTDRQWAYAVARGENQIYTPQIIVDGGVHVVGSDRAAIDAALAEAAAIPDVPITISFTDTFVRVEVGNAPAGIADHGTIWLFLYDTEETVVIGRGDNAGRTVSYHNVVRQMNRIGMWRGRAMTIEMPMAELRDAGADGVAVLLQGELPVGIGRVIGAAAEHRPG